MKRTVLFVLASTLCAIALLPGAQRLPGTDGSGAAEEPGWEDSPGILLPAVPEIAAGDLKESERNLAIARITCVAYAGDKLTEVVARLGEIEITRAEYEYRLAMLQLGPPEPMPERGVAWRDDPLHEAFAEVRGRYTSEERALATCVLSAAWYAEARRLGTVVSLEQARVYAAEVRGRLYEAGGEELPSIRLIEETLGAERYWTEVAPRSYARSFSEAAARRKVAAEDPACRSAAGLYCYGFELGLHAIDHLAILDDELAGQAGTDRVRRYLEDMRDAVLEQER